MDLSYLVSTVQAGDSVMVWGKCTWHLDLNPLENLSNVLDGSAAAVWRYHVNINQNRWAFVPWIIKTVLSDMMVLEVYIQMNYGLGLAADSHLGRTVKFNEALNSSNHFSYSKNQNVTKKCFWHVCYYVTVTKTHILVPIMLPHPNNYLVTSAFTIVHWA